MSESPNQIFPSLFHADALRSSRVNTHAVSDTDPKSYVVTLNGGEPSTLQVISPPVMSTSLEESPTQFVLVEKSVE